ncbi:MAG TPA: argininosuccinate lyase [Atribacteraceae bacterium]|nr:argininosuccinate lyase [Atribacteraceae bacterium]
MPDHPVNDRTQHKPDNATRLWGSRMEKTLDEAVFRFSTSIGEDYVLYPYDIWGSGAHCRMLARVGILVENEEERMIAGLRTVYHELETGRLDPSRHEDIHSLVEARLFEIIGEEAGKLHSGRSRNDQIVLDERLYLREKTLDILTAISGLGETLLRQAEVYPDLVMPGYTHLQPAQPVLFAHHYLAYCAMFRRDMERLWSALERINRLPLGAAALAGTSLPIDRRMVAELLDFPDIEANSMDAVSDRDFILEILADLAIGCIHLSRLGEEIVLWSSPAFGFITIDDAFTTGSSIMPQKKNPDVAELIRGKAGEALGAWVSLAVTLKGLPLTYNRDLQQDKPPLLRIVPEVENLFRIAAGLIEHITPNADRIREALRTGFLTATDLAEYLVEHGMPFRTAHAVVGNLVRELSIRGKSLRDIVPTDLGEELSFISLEELRAVTDEECSITRKLSLGSTAPAEVHRSIVKTRLALQEDNQRIARFRERWQESRERVGTTVG